MNTISRLLLCLVALVFSLSITGARCCEKPWDLNALRTVEFVWVASIQREEPKPFVAPFPDTSRLPVTPRIFPRESVPCGYHPQPAHC